MLGGISHIVESYVAVGKTSIELLITIETPRQICWLILASVGVNACVVGDRCEFYLPILARC